MVGSVFFLHKKMHLKGCVQLLGCTSFRGRFFFCTCGTPIKSDLSDLSDMSDKVPHRTLMQNQSVYQY